MAVALIAVALAVVNVTLSGTAQTALLIVLAIVLLVTVARFGASIAASRRRR